MIFIITGPSGVGKNTIINELSNHIDFHFSTLTQQDQEEK